MDNWKAIIDSNENSALKVHWGFDRIYATLETPGRYVTLYYHGEGKTVDEALAALDRDIKNDMRFTVPQEADDE